MHIYQLYVRPKQLFLRLNIKFVYYLCLYTVLRTNSNYFAV